LSLAAPRALIASLAGLAMLKILQTSFAAAFKGPHAFGALVSFLVTVADVPIFNIGAPFWGLLFGYLVARASDEGALRRTRLGWQTNREKIDEGHRSRNPGARGMAAGRDHDHARLRRQWFRATHDHRPVLRPWPRGSIASARGRGGADRHRRPCRDLGRPGA